MGNNKTIKIAKVILGVTNNGSPRAYIWEEGSNLDSQVDAIDIIGDQALYVATRHIGEEIELILGKFTNVKVPQDFIEASSKPTYKRVIGLYKKAIKSIDFALNGNKPIIDKDTARELLTEEINTFLDMQDTVYSLVSESKTKVCRDVMANINKPKAEQTLDPYQVLFSLTRHAVGNITKEYRIE